MRFSILVRWYINGFVQEKSNSNANVFLVLTHRYVILTAKENFPCWSDSICILQWHPRYSLLERVNSLKPRHQIKISVNFGILIQVSLKLFTKDSNNTNIGSDNGLVPNRQPTIIWISCGIVYWYICASLGFHELRLCLRNREIQRAWINLKSYLRVEYMPR